MSGGGPDGPPPGWPSSRWGAFSTWPGDVPVVLLVAPCEHEDPDDWEVWDALLLDLVPARTVMVEPTGRGRGGVATMDSLLAAAPPRFAVAGRGSAAVLARAMAEAAGEAAVGTIEVDPPEHAGGQPGEPTLRPRIVLHTDAPDLAAAIARARTELGRPPWCRPVSAPRR